MSKLLALMFSLVVVNWCLGTTGNKFRMKCVVEGEKCDSIRINIYPICAKYLINIGIIYTTKIVSDKQCEFEYEAQEDFFYINLVKYKGGRGVDLRFYDRLLLCSKSDNIICKWKSDSVEFSGRGSEKLTLQYTLPEYKNNELVEDGTFSPYIRNQELDEAILLKQLKMIDSYNSRLPKDELSIIRLNAVSNRVHAEIYLIRALFGMKSTVERKRYYIEWFKKLNIDETFKSYNSRSKYYSSSYCDAILNNILIVENLRNGGDTTLGKSQLAPMFQTITSKYTGDVLDKLLLGFNVMFAHKDQEHKYLTESAGFVKNPIVKLYYEKVVLAYGSGTMFNPFNFTSEGGKMVDESVFLGKVTLVDFWYTGCTSCAAMRKNLRIDVAKWKRNKSFQVITVSSDRDTSQWKKSLASGIYSDADDINVYSNGKGSNHPLYRKFLIQGFPWLILVDVNGRAIATLRTSDEARRLINPIISGL